MIHELIDPKKKKNKTTVSGNSKTIQNSKNIFEYCNFESSYYENKNRESSSTTFIPPWLRNSLGLNQRNVLTHAAACSDQKPTKIIQKDKETSHNEFDTLSPNTEEESCKELKNQKDLALKDCPQETTTPKTPDDAESVTVKSEKIPAYWKIRAKVSESDSNDAKYFGKGDWIKLKSDTLNFEDIGELKEEDIRKIKLFRQQSKLKKLMSSNEKPSSLNKTDIDFLLQMKARKVLEGFKNKEIHSISPEIKNLETKLLLLGAKSHDLNNHKLRQQDIRLLQEMKNQMIGIEDFERFIEHLKGLNVGEIDKKPEFPKNFTTDKKWEEKDDGKEKKNVRETTPKCEFDDRKDDDYSISTDDEDNVKKFSQFLSKNDNAEEKKKCLEEVRNYFERKRKLRLAKRHYLDDEKKKVKLEKKEENIQEKKKGKTCLKSVRSKYGLYDQDVVEKAVEDTLQKFIELYKINATPNIMESLKKSIFHCVSSSFQKSAYPPSIGKKINLDQTNIGFKNYEEVDITFPNVETNKESFREIKKRSNKTTINNQEVHLLKDANTKDIENFKRLKKEFDDFLNSVQFHIDFTNLKLQSVILEKEEQTSPSKNLQFVYNFTKKSLEQEKKGTEVPDIKDHSDTGTQTVTEIEISKRNVKVQAFEPKFTSEKILQTETTIGVTAETQTNQNINRINIRELKELRNNDVNSGLYRLIKSKEPGKFFLYPEELDNRKPSNNYSFLTGKKLHKRKEIPSFVSKNSSKDRRFCNSEKEKNKLRKISRLSKGLVRLEDKSNQLVKDADAKGDSVNCLYFKNLDRSHSRLFAIKKEGVLLEKNTDDSEDLVLGDGRDNFWFWNGEKLAPGADLKTHVEKLFKEKLTEMISFDDESKSVVCKPRSNLKKNKKDLRKVSKKNAILHFDDVLEKETTTQEGTVLSEEGHLVDGNKTKEKKNESEETEEVTSPLCEKKSVKNVSTQNSDQICTSINLSKLKIQTSKIAFPVKKKHKGNIVLKKRRGKPINLKKAENIVKAIEELKRIKLGANNSKEKGERDSEYFFNFSLSSKESKNEVGSPLPKIFPCEEVGNSDFKTKLEKLLSLVNCEIQTNDAFDAEDGNLIQNSPMEDHKHIELMETVLNRITNKERESLWNDVRDFINTRINRDVNDDDDREVCIEIEQDLHKNDRGKLHDILAKGHYRRNEGDIEVEIDLTLDDLEKILRQRQKKIRRRTLYRSSRSNKFLSTSSIQSEFTTDDFQKYQIYLQNLTTEQDLGQEKEMKAFL